MAVSQRVIALLVCIVVGVIAAAGDAPPPLSPGEQAFMESAFTGKLQQVQRAVADGVAVDTLDPEKRTAMMWAAFNGHTQIVRYLIEQGAKVEAEDASGRSALMYVSSGPYTETVKLLLDKGAGVNRQGKLEGFTALMTAAAEGQIEVVRILLAAGADPAIVDKDGDTAKSFAKAKGYTSVVELLDKAPAKAE